MSKTFLKTSIQLFVTSALIIGGYFSLAKSVLAAPPINNTSTGSFEATSSITTGTATSNLTVTDVTGGSPIITLVKRITAINGVPITGFVNDPATTADTDTKWPSPNTDYLRGAIACPSTGAVNCPAPQPTQTIEYTIYFLSNGTADATNVTICDLVPANTTFVSGAYNIAGGGNNLDIAFINSDPLFNPLLPIPPSAYLTGLFDSDRGNFFQPNVLPPTTCKKPTTNATLTAADNTNGLVVVDVVKRTTATVPVPAAEIIPFATGAGTPAKSYGFVRFTVKVN